MKYLNSALLEIKRIEDNSDLSALHRLSVELQNTLPETVVHENRILFIDALRVNHEEYISAYMQRLEARIKEIIADYQRKSIGSK
ncbi:hypothetical protein K8I28_10390 [bacterium]|nr:hypothetical protein [bacterium]